MVLFLSLVGMCAEARSIDPGTAWTIIVTLSGAIAAMALFIAKRETSRSREISRAKDSCAAEILRIKDESSKEVKDILQAQIREFKSHKELASTLIDVIDSKRKGG